MKVNDMISQIEKVFNEKWTGKRFEDIGDVHKDIRRIVKETFPNDLQGGTWEINLKNEIHLKLFTYDLDMIDDKRYKMSRAGRMNKLVLKPIFPINKNTTFEEFVLEVRKNKAEEYIENAEMTIDAIKASLREHEERLARAKEELASLK